MLLIGKRARRRFIESTLPVTMNGVYLTDEEVKELLYNIQKGTGPIIQISKQRLIINFIGMARSIASGYANQAPYLSEDLLGEAMLQLTRAITVGLASLPHDNVQAYLSKCLHGACNDYLTEEQNRLMGKDSLRHKRSVGGVVTQLLVETELKRKNSNMKVRRYEPSKTYDLYDMLNWIINQEPDERRRELKRQIIEQRMMGRNDRETGTELGITGDYVNKLRSEVAKIWRHLNE